MAKPIPPYQKDKRLIKINAISYAKLVKLMLDGTHTCQELADETGLHYLTVLQYARELYRVDAAHICAWEMDALGRDALKIYKIGPGKDAKRHKDTAAERQRRRRARIKAQETINMFAGATNE
jgi:hypothetical protein